MSDKYIDLMITSTNDEYNFIKNNYDFKNVALPGLCRFDNLIDNSKDIILLMPTFRKYLNFIDEFAESEYFKVYNNLLNSKKLDKILKKYNKTLFFYPHFEMQNI